MATHDITHPAHDKRVHAPKYDAHGRFLPEHAHRFPQHPLEADDNEKAVLPRADFPSTGTPQNIAHEDDTALDFEQSEQVTEAGHMGEDGVVRGGLEEKRENESEHTDE